MGVGVAKRITQGLESLGFGMNEVAFTNPLGLLLFAHKDGFKVLEFLAIRSDLVAEHRVPIRVGQI